MRIVVDAGPIIHLSWIEKIDVLARIFDEVVIPPGVRDEVLAAPPGTLGLDHIQRALTEGWLQVQVLGASAPPTHGSELGLGETQALALTEELAADLIVTDDDAARRAARGRGLEVTGTIGVLVEARRR